MDFRERYGPWAVVTGASEGTGRQFARQIAARGVQPILIGRRADPLAAVAEEIRTESGLECVVAPLDLANLHALDQIIEAVGEREVGLFVSNAGADPNGARFLDRDASVWLELVQRNTVTMMQGCHHFAGPMRDRGRGGLLLVNSGACYGGSRFMAAYSASKAFTLCFAESLWDELSDRGVDVLTLVMHMTDTPALRTLLTEKGLPLPDGIARAEDVAAFGLAHLRDGPVQNWGLKDDEAGYAGLSAEDRRRRTVAVGEASAHVFGKD